MTTARKRLASTLSDFDDGEDEVATPVRPRAVIRQRSALSVSSLLRPELLLDSSPSEDPDCALALHVKELDPELKLTFCELCEALESNYEVYRNHPNPEEWKRNLDALLETGQYSDETFDFKLSQTSTLRSESNEATSSPGNRAYASSQSYYVSNTPRDGTPETSQSAQHLRSDDSYEEFFYQSAETPDRESEDASIGNTQESDNESGQDTDTPRNTDVNSESPSSSRCPSHFDDDDGFRTPPDFVPSPVDYGYLGHSQATTDESDAVPSPPFPQENRLHDFGSIVLRAEDEVATRAPTPACMASDDEALKDLGNKARGHESRRPSSEDFSSRSPHARVNVNS